MNSIFNQVGKILKINWNEKHQKFNPSKKMCENYTDYQ